MRVIADVMRKKQAEFEREKRAFPIKLAQDKKRTLTRLALLTKRVKAAKSSEALSSVADTNVVEWSNRKDFVRDPSLNLCQEKQLLILLQNDVRKVVPINSNHELWAMLQGKCEPIV
jgi:hypothetical protein